jgi:DNA helicase II / ATP-dependent DNA helicase PcrA
MLNAQQRAAVEHSAGGLLIVEAGPGSGKTRVIQAHVKHLCHVQRVPPHHILVLTFSNFASTPHPCAHIQQQGVS